MPADVRVAQTAREAAKNSDAVVTCLPKPEHILDVVNGEEGLFAGAKSGMVWIDTSTTDFKQTRALAQTAQERGVLHARGHLGRAAFAPCKKNNMVCLGGGDAAAFEFWRPALQDAIGPVVVRCGDIGAGAIAKVASNMLAFVNMAAAAECLMLAKRAGLDIENFFDAIRASAGNSFAWEDRCAAHFLTDNTRRALRWILPAKTCICRTAWGGTCRFPWNCTRWLSK